MQTLHWPLGEVDAEDRDVTIADELARANASWRDRFGFIWVCE
jgi:hypothetical protein